MSCLPPSIGGSSFRGVIGVSRMDITPPLRIYSRSWAAAEHDRAEGIHRPLTLTCITFAAEHRRYEPVVLIGMDLMSWRSREDERFVREAILKLPLNEERLMICLSHTHAAPSVRRDDAKKPGGELIEPYLERLHDTALLAFHDAQARAEPATLTWQYGTCDLATNRDLPEPGRDRIVCGFNPDGPADHTLLVGRIQSGNRPPTATIVNYACHPTTLAWENRLISPDWVGAMRAIVEGPNGGAPCLFLQGASGELAPGEQYSGDTRLADRNGRRVGYAVRSVLEAMGPPGTQLVYNGVIESGAPLARWRREPAAISTQLSAQLRTVELPLKPGPSAAELEEQWRRCDDPIERERLWRKRAVRKVVGDGARSAVPLWSWRLGDALLVGQPNEAYSGFQSELRAKFAPRAVAVMNLVNGSAGYLPPREMYARDAYQVWQSPFAEGSLERLIDAAIQSLEKLV